MWYAVYEEATGALVSTGTVVAADLPPGLISIEIGPSAPVGQWRPATLDFDGVIPARSLDLLTFLRRFTIEEAAAVYAVAREDTAMEVLLERLRAADGVILTDVEVILGVEYCRTKGCISAARCEEILGRG